MNVPKKFIIAGKVTTLEFKREEHGGDEAKIIEEYGDRYQGLVESHMYHYATMKKAEELLLAHGIRKEDILMRPSRSYKADDMASDSCVISCGGDGELLDVVRVGDDRPLYLAVKSDGKSDGALTVTDYDGLENAIARVLNGKYDILLRQRVRADIRYPEGKHIIDDALNEVFIGDMYSVGYPRYVISAYGTTEQQRSSGIIVATGTGSTAWINNIAVLLPGGGYYRAEPFPPGSQHLCFVIRDARPESNYQLTHGYLGRKDEMSIRILERADSEIAFDCSKPWYAGARRYKAVPGARVAVYLSPKPIRTIKF